MNDKILGALLFVLQNDRYMAIYLIKHDDLISPEITGHLKQQSSNK